MSRFFERYSAPDPHAHAAQTVRLRALLAATEPGSLTQIDHAADLASLLTTAGQEVEAAALLAPLETEVSAHLTAEPAGWFYLAQATAHQYLQQHAKANAGFAEALRLAQQQGWERLAHFVHVHWGRSLAEEGRFAKARWHFEQALAQRERLQHPGAERVRQLLGTLDTLAARSA